jgi:thiamine-monophosphate kinase
MGGIPDHAMISLGLTPDTEVDHVAKLYTGMTEIARKFDVAIVGGDVSGAPLLIISPTVIGTVEKDKMLTRSGAVPGDQIAVTGYLGSSAAGLRMLKEGYELDREAALVVSEAHLRPCPRVSEGRLLGENGVKAAIDISDGLIADLAHICRASGVGARVRLPDIPIHPAVKVAFGQAAIDLALSGGEDYQLLFTAPGGVIERVKQRLSTPVTIIGEITSGKPGEVILLGETGREVEWKKRGWEHFGND